MRPNLKRLRPFPIFGPGPTASPPRAEQLAPYPAELIALSREMGGGATGFDAGARFRPDQPSGFEDWQGYLHIDFFYGCAGDSYGLLDRTAFLHEQEGIFGETCLAIAECAGGDMLLYRVEDGAVAFWKHDVAGHFHAAIVRDLPSLLERLEPELDEAGQVPPQWSAPGQIGA